MSKINLKIIKDGKIKLSELFNLQKNLKTLSIGALDKLKKNFIKNGFLVPFCVWTDDSGKNYIVDGHQRKFVLEEMEIEGATIPII